MGVPRQMPKLQPGLWGAPSASGIQAYRIKESYTMTDRLKSPYPYPGGKSDMAPAIWSRLGDPANYVEPFCGSAAVLLARPHDLSGKTETINDVDGFITNALRAIAYQPDLTAAWCDWPVSEADLTAVHLWLKAQRAELTARLFADPDYCDPCVAGRWLWGIASWIGDGWCVADGPWIAVDGMLVDRRTLPADGQVEGVRRKMPMVSGGHYSPDQGIQSYRASVPRKMPEIGRSPNGQIAFNRKGVQAVRYQEGVPKQMPAIAASKQRGAIERGVQAPAYEDSALSLYFARLSDRLRRVRFLCGDWTRACKDSVTVNHGTTGVFLDPPYPQAEHDMAYHSEQAGDVWHDAARWAVAHGDDPRLRICIAGYTSDATDALFPATWERVRWEARGGYANQKADGRGRANAKRECLWFSPHCLNPGDEAKRAFDKPLTVRESDFTGTMFE